MLLIAQLLGVGAVIAVAVYFEFCDYKRALRKDRDRDAKR